MARRLGIENPALLIALALAFGCNGLFGQDYGLPITLGATPAQVSQVLGHPGEIIVFDDPTFSASDTKTHRVNEYYHSKGLVALYYRDRLTGITVNRTGWKGHIPYQGTVINDVRVTDSKQAILQKLGEPTNVEEVAGQEEYTWRSGLYVVTGTFLIERSDGLSGGSLWSIRVERWSRPPPELDPATPAK